MTNLSNITILDLKQRDNPKGKQNPARQATPLHTFRQRKEKMAYLNWKHKIEELKLN